MNIVELACYIIVGFFILMIVAVVIDFLDTVFGGK
jgi:hypothetical protein